MAKTVKDYMTITLQTSFKKIALSNYEKNTFF